MTDRASEPTRDARRIIEVFADVCCPFTHVGLRRFVERRRERGRDDVVLRVRAWPLELVNGHPLDPELVGEEIDQLRANVAPELFSGFSVGRFPRTSLGAMALADVAYRTGGDRLGETVSLALRDAVFEEGIDVGDTAVLARLGERFGLAAPGSDAAGSDAAARHDWEEGRGRGVVGSPHYFVGADDFFCPSLDISRVDGHLRVVADEAEFAAFLDRCFA